MKKKASKTQARQKDPKKVLAGKARAQKAIRVNGRFVSKKFSDKIKEFAEISGYSDPYKYYLQNKTEIDTIFKQGYLTNNRNTGQLHKDLKGYQGEVTNKGKVIKAETMRRKIRDLNNFLKNQYNINAVDFYTRYKIGLDGERIDFNFPDISEVVEALGEDYDFSEDNGDSFFDFFDQFDITTVISNKK